MASLMIERMRSVMWYLQIAEITEGFSPRVERHHRQAARRVHDVGVAADAGERLFDAFELADRRLELRADARVGAGGTREPSLPAAIAIDGSEIERPAARHSTSIRQPLPTCFSPPMIHSIGMKTSVPELGPFMNAAASGMWRRPMFTPLCEVGINASVMPMSSLSPRSLLGIEELEGDAEDGRRPGRA